MEEDWVQRFKKQKRRMRVRNPRLKTKEKRGKMAGARLEWKKSGSDKATRSKENEIGRGAAGWGQVGSPGKLILNFLT